MASAEPNIVAKPIPRHSRWRWKLLIGLALLVAAEFFAQGKPWSEPRYSSFLRYQHVFTPALQPARGPDGAAYWMTHDPRHPVQWIDRRKDPEALRVLCFGGSATAGLGHSPNVTFPRHLEVLLRKAYPERPIEVLNLGTVAISSKQVLELVRDAIRHAEPDLMIVYSGNNEFLEVHAREFARTRGTWKTKLGSALRRSALVRTIERAVQGDAVPSDMPDRRPGQSGHTQAEIIAEIEIGAELREQTQATYVSNLVTAAERAGRRDIPIVVCTVAANWLWSGKEPRTFPWKTPAEARERIAALEAENTSGLSVKAIWQRLLERADALVAAGDPEAAARAYQVALEMDPHQRRATLGQGIALKEGLVATPARIFDSSQFFLSRSEQPWIGFEEFYDYVHFTPYGAALLAEGLYIDLVQTGWLPGAQESVAHGYALQHRNEVLSRAALAETPDFFEPDRFLGIGLDPDNLTSRNLWKYEAMALELDQAIAENPQNPTPWIYRGNRRSFQQGQGESAIEDWQRALQLGGPAGILEPAIEAMQARPTLRGDVFR